MWFRYSFLAKNGFFNHNPFVHSLFSCNLELVFWHKMANYYHNPFVHSFFSCGLNLVFWHKMAIFYHNPFVHSFFLCGLVFQHKMAFFDHNLFVHSFFLALKLNNFVSYISIDGIDCLTLEKNVVLMKILKNKMEFTDFPA